MKSEKFIRFAICERKRNLDVVWDSKWAAGLHLVFIRGIRVVDSFYFFYFLFLFYFILFHLLFKEMILVCVVDSFGPFESLVKQHNCPSKSQARFFLMFVCFSFLRGFFLLIKWNNLKFITLFFKMIS